jgi:hypothetical protein
MAATPAYDPKTHELAFRYLFETMPTAESSATNPPQKVGSAIARISLDRPDGMSIIYTNERSQGGDIVLRRAARLGSRKDYVRAHDSDACGLFPALSPQSPDSYAPTAGKLEKRQAGPCVCRYRTAKTKGGSVRRRLLGASSAAGKLRDCDHLSWTWPAEGVAS